MEDKSDIKILREFAKSTNRAIVVRELPYPKSGIGIIQKMKRTVYVPNNIEKNSFFLWFNDPYYKIGQTTVFSGAFIPISSRIKSKLNIRKRNILDKLKILSKTKTIKIGNDYFDSRVVISGDLDMESKRFLSQSRIQKQILKALKIESNTLISINEYKIDFVPELNHSPYLSIINRYGWDIDKNKIEIIFNQIEKIRDVIN